MGGWGIGGGGGGGGGVSCMLFTWKLHKVIRPDRSAGGRGRDSTGYRVHTRRIRVRQQLASITSRCP